MRGPLGRRDFALLWWGGLVSVAGDWTLMAVLPFVVYERTGSTIATAGMTVAELLPGILLGSPAGVLVDRWDRRHLLVRVNLLQAVVVLGLLGLAVDDALVAVVYVVAALQSGLAAFSMPAETALLPTLVPPEELVAANSLNQLNNRLGRFAGLPVGPLAYSLGGIGAVAAVDALTFLVAAVLVSLVRTRPAYDAARDAAADGAVVDAGALRGFLREWGEGIATIRRDRAIGVLFVVFSLMTFGGTMLDPLFAPWVRDVLHGTPATYALLTGVGAAAGIAGSLALGSVAGSLSPRLLCGVGGIVAGALLVVRFNVPVLWVAVALGAVAGVTSVASSVGVETLAQERVPEAVRGRVFGSLQATIWLASLLGAAVGGVAAEVFGLVPLLDLAAGLVLLSGVVVLLALPSGGPPGRRTPGAAG